MSAYRTFVVPYDFSVHSQLALETAADLARRLHADVHLLHVLHVPALAYTHGVFGVAPAVPAIDAVETRKRAMADLGEVAEGVESPAERPEAHVVEGVSIADAIGETAEGLGADLIIMGTHGRTGLAHVFLGSVAERTLRRASCPVLTVRAQEAPEGAEA